MIAAIWSVVSMVAYVIVGGVALLVLAYWFGACVGFGVSGFREGARKRR